MLPETYSHVDKTPGNTKNIDHPNEFEIIFLQQQNLKFFSVGDISDLFIKH